MNLCFDWKDHDPDNYIIDFCERNDESGRLIESFIYLSTPEHGDLAMDVYKGDLARMTGYKIRYSDTEVKINVDYDVSKLEIGTKNKYGIPIAVPFHEWEPTEEDLLKYVDYRLRIVLVQEGGATV